METNNQWVDFRLVKNAVTMQMALDRYGIDWLRKSGQELRGKCPLHQGEGERTFHVNLGKNAFNCFSCKARGNVLDFVAAMEQCTVRDAALKLAEWFQVDSAAEKPPGVSKPESTAKEVTKAKKPLVANPPLSFQLRVDAGHEYGARRGINRETLELFGAGLCLSKGTFAGRFIIPLHDQEGRLVGYAGRSLDESEPKYLFPSSDKGFYKSELIFNLHRALARVDAGEPVIVTEGIFDCLKLWQAGYKAVAILGSSLSETQEHLLATNFKQIILLFDGDAAGRKATDECLKRLARRAFVRVIELPDGQQPDQLSAEELQSLVGMEKIPQETS